jgi:hypothetical protein
MTNFVTLLRAEFTKLAQQFSYIQVHDVTSTDLFYSDGISKDAVFKVVIYAPDSNVCVGYVWHDGRFILLGDMKYNELFEGCVRKASRKWNTYRSV